MDKLQRRRTSWLTWAMQNDVEQALRAEALGVEGTSARVETYEYGVQEEILAGIYAITQMSDKPSPFPSPHTARDTIKRDRAVERWQDLQATVTTTSDAEYQADPRYLAGLNEMRQQRGLPPLSQAEIEAMQ